MKFNEIIKKIVALSADNSLSFPEKANQLQLELNNCTRGDILLHLNFAGVIPEYFGHDSTEEKLYAKYCDALVARALTELGIKAKIIAERSGAADVLGVAEGYSLVADAKAFRLSRTAKNQKDFKVEALNQWRAGADFACLVSPFYQYPINNSQIYSQAIRYNVTLLSYTHIAFMIRSECVNANNLIELWQVGEVLKKSKGISDNASSYWSEIIKIILKIAGRTNLDWEKEIQSAKLCLKEQGKEQVLYWEEQKKKIQNLDQRSAVNLLVKLLKIDKKIQMVRKTAGI